MQTRTDAIPAVMTSLPMRALPVVAIAPNAIRLAPSAITDAATRAAVDAKLNAALKEQLKQAIGAGDGTVGALVDGMALDYHAVIGETILSVIQKVVVPAMERQPALAALATALLQRKDAPGAPTVESLLQPNVPLAQHPLFVADVRQGRGRELLRISNLNQDLVTKIDAGQKPLEAWNSFD